MCKRVGLCDINGLVRAFLDEKLIKGVDFWSQNIYNDKTDWKIVLKVWSGRFL